MQSLVAVSALILSTCAFACAQEASPMIAYAPDVVGADRIFLVALNVPPGTTQIGVTVPQQVKLLDKTPLPAKGDLAKFYFRAIERAEQIEIGFDVGAEKLSVPLTIWSFEDLRKFRTRIDGLQLPRRWPLGEPLPELKEGRTITTQAELDALKGNPGTAPQWLDVSDDDIWAMQPDSTIPRWHWVNIQYGCPVHGPAIFEKVPYYPWDKDRSLPHSWKIRCPIGGELYPSNDFAHDDFTSGDFPDDGIGGGYIQDGKHYGFLAELAQAYAHQILYLPAVLAQGYVATGDVRYVHKALVAFSRLAVEYAYLATMTHHRHRNSVYQVERLGQDRFASATPLFASGFTVYSIDQPGYQMALSAAYDRILPAIAQDQEIIPYLQSKGFDVKTHEDVRRFIEENLFAVWMQGSMDEATESNEPYAQWGMVQMAQMLNYRRGSDFMDWLYDGAGHMRTFVTNGFFRDGAPYESTGGYNGMHVTALGPIVDGIEALRKLRPEAYPESKYPSLAKSRRYHSVFDFDMETVTIDRSFPWIGDTGSWTQYQPLGKTTWQAGGAIAYEHAYTLFRDPKFAWALANAPGWSPSLNFPFTREQVEADAAKWSPTWNDASSLHDGYGVAILRGGAGDEKRALWLRYGICRGHNQDDLMDIGLQAHKGVLLSHMGYPRNWGYWEYSWTSHYVARQFPGRAMTARAELFTDAGPVHVAEAHAQSYEDRVADGGGYQTTPDRWQRRLLALVDVGPERYYAVDLYRIFGGAEHWWAFHGQEGDFVTEGIALTKQEGGTLAGADVPYGDATWLKENGCSSGTYGWRGERFAFAHLYNVERGRSAGVWSADWKLKTGDGLHLKLTVADASGAEVNVCDGTSPAGGKPYEMKWIMMKNTAPEATKTQVLSLLESYRDTPTIRQTTPLTLSGADEGGFEARGARVELEDRTDYIMAAGQATTPRLGPDGLSFAGRFGFIREKDGAPETMVLIGGTSLRKGDYGIRLDAPAYRGSIIAVDRTTETITVSRTPQRPEAIAGQVVFIGSGDRRSAYRVLEARALPGGRAGIRLDLDSRIGIGRVTGVDDWQVKTETAFPLQYHRYYDGARIANADGSVELRTDDVRSKSAAYINRAAHPDLTTAQLAALFPEGSWFEVYDYGVGDYVEWPYVVTLSRTAADVYRLTAPCRVRVDLPPGMTLEAGR